MRFENKRQTEKYLVEMTCYSMLKTTLSSLSLIIEQTLGIT